jgi:bifunctional non-homologous end joining protein LigD
MATLTRPPKRASAKLARYRAKRDFARTPEPSGDATVPAPAGAQFVVQAHAARRMHYDFRLELDGVLLSWSVPKGPSLVPGDRRLAVRTEDHPLDYAGFEGIIPKGEYGGGTVVVWDRGTWTREDTTDAAAAVKKGRLTFALHGEKLRGRFHLVRTRSDDAKHENWLLFKGRDEHASERDIVAERPQSVITGRTLEQVAADADAVWHSNRATPAAGAPAATAAPRDLATLVKSLPVGFELTNLDKVLYREQGLTKAALLAYLAVTADWILPHVARRPLTLVRCPDGPGKNCFFQKHYKDGMPPPVHALAIPDEDDRYMEVRDMPGLVGLAQLGSLELHTWGCRTDQIERPDLMVFDLDPDPAVAWDRVVESAFAMRTLLEGLGLVSFVKTTGGKGLHVTVPVTRHLDWDAHKVFTRGVAEKLVAAAPKAYTTNPKKAARANKIFIDYLRNGRGATFVAPYSPRARASATVATPVGWDELAAGVDPTTFTVASVPPRLAELTADPWAELPALSQRVTAAARKTVGG